MLLTIELEYHLFLELDESITLTCCLCVCGKMIYYHLVETF